MSAQDKAQQVKSLVASIKYGPAPDQTKISDLCQAAELLADGLFSLQEEIDQLRRELKRPSRI
jgi:hypothetical protein